MKAREALRAILATGAVRIYSALAAAGTLIVAARWLGPAGRGTLAAAISFPQLVASIGSLSLGQVIIHRAAARRGQPWISEAVASLLSIALLASLAGWALTAAIWALGPGPLAGTPPIAVLLGALHLPFLVWDLLAAGTLVAAQGLPAYNRALVFGRTLSLALMIALLPLLHLGLVAALCASLAGQMLAALLSLRALLSLSDGPLRPSLAVSLELASGGLRLHLSALGAGWVNAAVALLLQSRAGALETGYYTLANDGLAVLFLASQAVAQVLSADAAARGPDESLPLLRKLFAPLAALSSAAMALAYLCAPPLIARVLGEAYLPAVPVFRLLLLTVPAQLLAVAVSPQWIARGYFWQASLAMAAVAAANLALAALWPTALGAARASVAAYALIAAVNLALLAHVSRAAAGDGDVPSP